MPPEGLGASRGQAAMTNFCSYSATKAPWIKPLKRLPLAWGLSEQALTRPQHFPVVPRYIPVSIAVIVTRAQVVRTAARPPDFPANYKHLIAFAESLFMLLNQLTVQIDVTDAAFYYKRNSLSRILHETKGKVKNY